MNLLSILLLDQLEIFNSKLIDIEAFAELTFRFLLNTGVLMLLVRWIYYSTARRKDYLFTYMLIGSIVFLLCFLLGSVKLQIGFALGLFAIFGIMRYRTSQMPIKEMTYLFLVIALSVINALANEKVSLLELLFPNLVIIFMTLGFEKFWRLPHQSIKEVVYEKIELIRPEKRQELIADLTQRTGISNIRKVEIGRIDLLKDICILRVYYSETGQDINMADNDSRDEDGDED
jgi:hypothetical protein